MDEKQVYAVRTYLNGRQMLSSEWPFSNQLLSACIEQKLVESKPAIVYANNHWHCERCGNHSKHLFYTHYCFRCTQLCTYCRHCFSMGKVSTCTHLLQWKGRPFFFLVQKMNPVNGKDNYLLYKKRQLHILLRRFNKRM